VSLQSIKYTNQIAVMTQIDLIDMGEYTDDFAGLEALMSNLDIAIRVVLCYGHLAVEISLTTWHIVIQACDGRCACV
jgi:hypothetical protein